MRSESRYLATAFQSTLTTSATCIQQIAQHVSRSALATPKETANMLEPERYTGVRITEGCYDSGEKFVDNTPWSSRLLNRDLKKQI